MFSALKKLARSGDDRCPAPMPMSSSLQKKFSRGVHFNMKILIKGDRNVGKSCLLQRLQGGPFIEEYVPTDQIQVAPIHWTYKSTDYVVKVEVWEVVDKGRTKKKPPLGLKLDNQSLATAEEGYETPVLDATFLDVYKNATGVILMLDITKPWTFEYVVKELSRVPADLPVVVLGNHCDMQHHRQVHPHHIETALHHAKMTRTAPVRYAESSMRNGFGLRLLHKFLSVPFLRLQKTSLLEQLQRNQRDVEEVEKELDEFQNSEESQYNVFMDRLASKRREGGAPAAPRANNERAPSIVLGAGKPIVPPNLNPLLGQSFNPNAAGVKTQPAERDSQQQQGKQSQYVSQELLQPKHSVSMDMTPPRLPKDSAPSTQSCGNASTASGALDEFYAGALDSSFLEDLTPVSNATGHQDIGYDSDSDDGDAKNPMVTVDEDDLEADLSPINTSLARRTSEIRASEKEVCLKQSFLSSTRASEREDDLRDRFMEASISKEDGNSGRLELNMENDFTLWAGDSSARRSPEGGEDPDTAKETDEKSEKKHKKKKSKDKDRGDYSEKSERKEKRQKHKKSKSEKRTSNPQQDLLPSSVTGEFNYEEYDSI